MIAAEPPIRDAATTILVRRGAGGPSVLMGMRGAQAAFMPSKYVFPGGAVDDTDAALTPIRPLGAVDRRRLLAAPRPGASCTPEALAVAALRELAEETGLMIGRPGGGCPLPGFADAGLVPDAGALVFLFRAITPPGRTRRFDARFFLADAQHIHGDPDDLGAACDELSHLHWVALADARALDLPFITEVVLAELANIVARAGDGPLRAPATVPFFDNRTATPQFSQIA